MGCIALIEVDNAMDYPYGGCYGNGFKIMQMASNIDSVMILNVILIDFQRNVTVCSKRNLNPPPLLTGYNTLQ